MKLIVITVVKEFEEDVKKLLFEAGVKEFTMTEAIGCRNASMESLGDNWFASDMNETDSSLFWIFTTQLKAEKVFAAAEEFNGGRQSLSRIHLSILPIEKTI